MATIKIPIQEEAYRKMFLYADYAKKLFDSEIAGWGHYTPSKGIYKLAPLPKQIVQRAEVDTFPNMDTKYDISDCVVQWHSHIDMSVFFSSTDINNIKECMGVYPVLISIVVNCKGEYKARMDISRVKFLNEEIPTELSYDVELEIIREDKNIEKEVKKMCSVPKPTKINYDDVFYGKDTWLTPAFSPPQDDKEKRYKEALTELFLKTSKEKNMQVQINKAGLFSIENGEQKISVITFYNRLNINLYDVIGNFASLIKTQTKTYPEVLPANIENDELYKEIKKLLQDI